MWAVRVVEAVLKHSVFPKLVLYPPLPLYLRPREPISYPDCADISSDVLSFRVFLGDTAEDADVVYNSVPHVQCCTMQLQVSHLSAGSPVVPIVVAHR